MFTPNAKATFSCGAISYKVYVRMQISECEKRQICVRVKWKCFHVAVKFTWCIHFSDRLRILLMPLIIRNEGQAYCLCLWEEQNDSTTVKRGALLRMVSKITILFLESSVCCYGQIFVGFQKIFWYFPFALVTLGVNTPFNTPFIKFFGKILSCKLTERHVHHQRSQGFTILLHRVTRELLI